MVTAPARSALFNDGWWFVPHNVDPAVWPPDAEAVALPHTWNALDGADGGNDYRRGVGSYVKRFTAEQDDLKTWLEFRGVSSSADVYLNGRHLARHEGGYSTFRVDLTAALATENTLVVVADNAPSDTIYPQRADFTFYGGLYRDVYLLRVPDAHVVLDAAGGPGFEVTPAFAGSAAIVSLRVAVTGGDGVRFTIEGVGQIAAPVRDGVAEASLVIDDVRRWHGLRDPHLYTASAAVLVAGETVDRVELRFGCREFAIDCDRGFILNGEEYPLRGVSRHQDWQGVGNAISPAHMEADVDLLLELGATTVRLAHYQHDQYFYDLCDAAGIVVWAEIPQITGFLPNARPNATSQLIELIMQNRHHPSIVCWGLSNEITVLGNTPELLAAHRELHELAHRLDPTRMTTMAHLFLLETDDPLVSIPDVMSYNLYFGWYVGDLADNDAWFADFRAQHPGKAIGLSEYGADANLACQTATPIRGDYTEQYQARYHEHMLTLIEASPYLWATHVWSLADFAADGRSEGGVAGRNTKGLVSFDRQTRKDAFYLYKAAWSNEPFVHVCGRRYVDRAEDITEVTVYSNADEVTLARDGEIVGTTSGRRVFRFEVPIHGTHVLTATAGEASDSLTVRRVDQPNPGYSLGEQAVTNWFDVDLPAPDGFYSVHDTLNTLQQTPHGRVVVDQIMSAAASQRGDVAQQVEIPESMQRMIGRQKLIHLIQQAGGGLPGERLAALNAQLNQIPKLEAAP